MCPTISLQVLERTLTDGSTKRFRRRNLNVVTVHKKPIAITAGDVPLRVQDVEVEEDFEEGAINLDDWEIVEKTLPDGRKKKFYRKILTTIFSSLDDKNEMIENPPIHIEEEEIYEVSKSKSFFFVILNLVKYNHNSLQYEILQFVVLNCLANFKKMN